MAKQKISIRSWEPDSITIEPGVTLDILVKRLGNEEYHRFDRLFWRGVTSEADRLVLVRHPGDEQERTAGSALSEARLADLQAKVAQLPPTTVPDARGAYGAARALLLSLVNDLEPTDKFKVSDEEVRRRRLVALTEAERASYDAMRLKDMQAYAEFLDEALSQFVRVVPGQIDFEDVDAGQTIDVTTGADFVRCFGARGDVLQQVVILIRQINQLSDAQKKELRSHSDSSGSSKESGLSLTGLSSEPTAAPAESSASATTEAAIETAGDPSGMTAP